MIEEHVGTAGNKRKPGSAPQICQRLAELVSWYTEGQGDGQHLTALEPLAFIRESAVDASFSEVCEPTLAVVVQGEKVEILGEERYLYRPATFLVLTVDLPISGVIVRASPSEPYLAVKVKLDLAQLAEVLAQVGTREDKPRGGVSGLSRSDAGLPLLEAVMRLVQLLETPQDQAFLAPLLFREFYYRLLTGPQSEALRQIATKDSATQRVAAVLKQIKRNFAEPLRMDDLAEQANMSSATFYRHFKNVTSLSPLQYQKQLRLLEARRLLLSQSCTAAHAAYQVGYENPAQFSREYAREFGAPPIEDVTRLRVT